MNDPVTSAARALREMVDGSSSDHASTRQRIVAKVALRRSRRRRAFAAIWWPLAAVLLVSSAWAAVTGRVPRLVALLGGAPHEPPPMAKNVASGVPSVTAGEVTTAPIPSAIASAAPRAIATPSPSVPTNVAARASTPASTARASTQGPAPARPDDEEALYSAAHHAHFVAHDPAAALRGWDEYLAAYPAGRFGLEARYNRGLALVRLGRIGEAREALTPFADGRSGGYRQAEARSLLDALAAEH